jgi:endoglucanase
LNRLKLAALITLAFGCQETNEGSTKPFDQTSTDGGAALPAVPLHTQSRWIVDANGKRFKLASVNWYGADEKDYVVGGLDRAPLDTIAASIRTLGFNSVRLPWSNELVEKDPLVADAALAANPALKGKHALEILDIVIDAIARQGLLVILDNHISHADWCCSGTDGEGLWYTADYPESSWLADWRMMAKRYKNQPAVVGAELRNELRPANGQKPVWGGGDPKLDWHAAAQRGGNAVLAENPNLLIVVDGLDNASHLFGVRNLPISLSVPNRLVYGAHDYSFFDEAATSYDDYVRRMGDNWGYILAQGKPYTAPIWVSEFGTCNTGPNCIKDSAGRGRWMQWAKQYLMKGDVDWGYWPLNGTQSTGTGRTPGGLEYYGVLDTTWTKPALPELTALLQELAPATQHP